MQMIKKRKRKNGKKKTELEEMIAFMRGKPKYKKLVKHLKDLGAMIGMDELKKAVIGQIQFIVTNDHKLDEHYLNTVLQGPPGCGKTTVAEILYNIWTSLELFDENTEFTILHRSDLVGTYMGHTANKTRKLLTKLAGGVIFIDEAYSLISGEKDEYGKEALDQINAFLSEEKGQTVMILAGYEQDLNERIFESNAGLKRRFGWQFTIAPYTAEQLFQIFKIQLKKHGWTCDLSTQQLFVEHFDSFKHAGGDTENIAFKAKLEYCRDNWQAKRQTRKLSVKHVERAMQATFVQKEDSGYLNMYM